MKNWIIGILSVLMLSNIVSAGVILTVTPVGPSFAVQGGTIEYQAIVTVEDTGLGSPWQEEIFSVDNADKQPGWNYNFNPGSVTVNDIAGESQSSILTMTIPSDAPTGTYSHTIIATGYDEVGQMIGIETEIDTYIVSTPVEPIPELNTGILMSAGMIGLVLISRRYKK